MPPEFGRKWGTECLNTRFPLHTLLYAGYSVKLIYLFFNFIHSISITYHKIINYNYNLFTFTILDVSWRKHLAYISRLRAGTVSNAMTRMQVAKPVILVKSRIPHFNFDDVIILFCILCIKSNKERTNSRTVDPNLRYSINP